MAGALPQSHPSVRGQTHGYCFLSVHREKKKVGAFGVKECKLKILSVNKQAGQGWSPESGVLGVQRPLFMTGV